MMTLQLSVTISATNGHLQLYTHLLVLHLVIACQHLEILHDLGKKGLLLHSLHFLLFS